MGGLKLVPAMNLLISHELIIDIGELAELRNIAVSQGVIQDGTLTRQYCFVWRGRAKLPHLALLAEAMRMSRIPIRWHHGTAGQRSRARRSRIPELQAAVALNATIIVAVRPASDGCGARFFTGDL